MRKHQHTLPQPTEFPPMPKVERPRSAVDPDDRMIIAAILMHGSLSGGERLTPALADTALKNADALLEGLHGQKS